MIKGLTVSLLAIVLSLQITHGQKLSRNEKKIISNVERNMAACLSLLENSVNLNSGTRNIKGVEENGKLLRPEFDRIGFATTWIPMPQEMQRAGHLFAEMKGSKGKRLLLIGHLDTVFEPYSSFQQYRAQDTIAYGPGTNDMKGGNLVILFALRALHDAGQLNDVQIIVALHGDEEDSGDPIEISRRDIIEASKRSDVALAFETGTAFSEATVARRGSSSWKLVVEGMQAHSSGIFGPNVGAGAIYEASRIINRFYDELKEQYLTYNVGLISGGTETTIDSAFSQTSASGKSNVVANRAYASGDLRFLSEEQKERAREKMRAIVAQNLPQTKAHISFQDGIPAMPPTEGNQSLLKLYSEVSVDLGLGEVRALDPNKRGAGDISFVAEYVDCLDGIGAMGKGAHSPSEYIDLRTLDEQIKRAALMIYRLTR